MNAETMNTARMPIISILGMGYVGCTLATCLGNDGHKVLGCELDVVRRNRLKSGLLPFDNLQLQVLFEQVEYMGRFRVVDDPREAVLHSDITFICVGTPTTADGDFDHKYVLDAAETIGEALAHKSGDHTVVVKSTVRPGITKQVYELITKQSGRLFSEVSVVFNPEFLREASLVDDYYHPPFIVIGDDAHNGAAHYVQNLFRKCFAPTILTSVRGAEMIKLACNTYHALKVTFANEIASISAHEGVDPLKVMAVLASDHKLNNSALYLKPGGPFWGHCLPKDVRALTVLAREAGVSIPMIEAILVSNGS